MGGRVRVVRVIISHFLTTVTTDDYVEMTPSAQGGPDKDQRTMALVFLVFVRNMGEATT